MRGRERGCYGLFVHSLFVRWQRSHARGVIERTEPEAAREEGGDVEEEGVEEAVAPGKAKMPYLGHLGKSRDQRGRGALTFVTGVTNVSLTPARGDAMGIKATRCCLYACGGGVGPRDAPSPSSPSSCRVSRHKRSSVATVIFSSTPNSSSTSTARHGATRSTR